MSAVQITDHQGMALEQPEKLAATRLEFFRS
jgi:hypothetical protein